VTKNAILVDPFLAVFGLLTAKEKKSAAGTLKQKKEDKRKLFNRI